MPTPVRVDGGEFGLPGYKVNIPLVSLGFQVVLVTFELGFVGLDLVNPPTNQAKHTIKMAILRLWLGARGRAAGACSWCT